MSPGERWRAEMLVQLSQSILLDSTVTRNDGDDVSYYHEAEDTTVERAVGILDLILAEVGKPKCADCAAINDSIERLDKGKT